MRWKSHVRFGERVGETGQQKRWTPRPDPTPQRHPPWATRRGRVLDAFHVVRLGTQAVDEVRRRVQQDTLGCRGHKHDPLYKIRGLLRHGAEHLTEKQQAKISHCLDAGDPGDEVNVAWQCYQQLRSIYHATPATGREIAQKVLDSFHTCPIPEVARLGRTLRAWRSHVLAYFDTSGVSNGGTEAINMIIEKIRRLRLQ
jgi:transposase